MGERRLDWAMMLSGFVIGLPVFFQVGLVLLAPVMFTVAQPTGTPLLRLGLPLVAGLSTAHGLVPPHPGPVAAMALLHADTGRTLLYSLIVGFPTAIISGPLFARFDRAGLAEPGTMAAQLAGTDGIWTSPVAGDHAADDPDAGPADACGGAGAGGAACRDESGTGVRRHAAHGDAAFDPARAADVRRRLRLRPRAHPAFAEESLPPIASVLLVVGAGGGFARVLDVAGVDTAIAQAMSGPALAAGAGLADRIAAAHLGRFRDRLGGDCRRHHGADRHGHAGVNRELLVVAIGAGSLIAGHVNDGGFWLVKGYLNTTVPQTLATWTILETIVAVCGLGGVLPSEC